jgi:hypothetical protein
MVHDLVNAMAAPVVAALIAGLGAVLAEWRQGRNRDYDRRRLLADALGQVSFIEAWGKAHELVTPTAVHDQLRTRAQEDLERVYIGFMESLEQVPAGHNHVTISKLLRSLLLRGRAKSGTAKAVRLLYYLSLLLVTFWIAVGSSTLTSFRISSIMATIVVAVFALLPPWGLHSLVVWLDQRNVAAHADVDGAKDIKEARAFGRQRRDRAAQ